MWYLLVVYGVCELLMIIMYEFSIYFVLLLFQRCFYCWFVVLGFWFFFTALYLVDVDMFIYVGYILVFLVRCAYLVSHKMRTF